MSDVRKPRPKRPRREDDGPAGSGLPRPLPDGTKLREDGTGREAVILDHARQYAHPQAAPVFHYLVRWDDGQTQGLAEAALAPGRGIEVLLDFGEGEGD